MIQDAQFGCVKFDNQREHRSGWAAIAGGKAFRIAATRDLSSDVIWMHNLDYEMTSASGMISHAGFRANQFLSECFIKNHSESEKKDPNFHLNRLFTNDLSTFLGAHPDDPTMQVERVALLFDRVMRIAQKIMNIQATNEYQLHQHIRQLIMGYDSILPENIIAAIEDSRVNWVNVERETQFDNGNEIKMNLSLPRAEHGARSICHSMPIGEWHPINPPSGRSSEALDAWIDEIGSYCLANISVENPSPSVYRLINFGSGRKNRRWVTGNELRFLNQVSNITIKAAFCPSGTTDIPLLTTLINTFDPIHNASVSAGIFWQIIWQSFCAKYTPPAHVKKGRQSINCLEPFIRATDRNACLSAAISLQKKGIQVTGYSKGRISILHDGDNIGLAQVCREVGLIPPFLNCPENDTIPINTSVDMLQEIYAQGSYDQLNDADQQITDLICQT